MIVYVFPCLVSDVLIFLQSALWLIERPFTLVEVVYMAVLCDNNLSAPITPLIFQQGTLSQI